MSAKAIEIAPAATRSFSQRRKARQNGTMPAVSQTLIQFANNYRQVPSPGIEVIVKARYEVMLQPDFPIAGPNSVSWIRCRAADADEVISEARAIVATREIPVMWVLDPGTVPPDFATRLDAHGIRPDPHGHESAVMVLPVEAPLEAPHVQGLEIRDALADLDSFRAADAAAAEAFMATHLSDDPAIVAAQDRRRINALAARNRHLLLATIDGESAGSGSVTLFPPLGATMNGGSVRPKFRGRGVYRALVAARLEIARQAGLGGLSVWAGEMSGPILSRLGFQKVGWRRFYLDEAAAPQR